TMHEHEKRAAAAGAVRHEQVERVALMWPIFDVARDLDARIGFLAVHRDVERLGLGGIADAADGRDLVDKLGRHLCQGLACGQGGDSRRSGTSCRRGNSRRNETVWL